MYKFFALNVSFFHIKQLSNVVFCFRFTRQLLFSAFTLFNLEIAVFFMAGLKTEFIFSFHSKMESFLITQRNMSAAEIQPKSCSLKGESFYLHQELRKVSNIGSLLICDSIQDLIQPTVTYHCILKFNHIFLLQFLGFDMKKIVNIIATAMFAGINLYKIMFSVVFTNHEECRQGFFLLYIQHSCRTVVLLKRIW